MTQLQTEQLHFVYIWNYIIQTKIRHSHRTIKREGDALEDVLPVYADLGGDG